MVFTSNRLAILPTVDAIVAQRWFVLYPQFVHL